MWSGVSINSEGYFKQVVTVLEHNLESVREEQMYSSLDTLRLVVKLIKYTCVCVYALYGLCMTVYTPSLQNISTFLM